MGRSPSRHTRTTGREAGAGVEGGMRGAPFLLLFLLTGAAVAAIPPRRDALEESREALVLPNPGLAADDGHAYGFGDASAGNGLPDGWRTSLKAGVVSYTAHGALTRVHYAGAKGTVLSKLWPAQPGDSYVLRTTLDTGPKSPNPGSLGIAFLANGVLVDYALYRLQNEYPGPQGVEIRASAPPTTDEVAVRWVWTTSPEMEGEIEMAPLQLERIRAQSRTAFTLPHVFLVTIETLRADHTSLHGYTRATTPNLARIAAQGAVFRNHTVQAPYTRPSLSSLVTSRYPVSLGITENVPPLPAEAVTVAERFADHGYVTAGFLAQFLLSSHFGFNQGFHTFRNHPNDTPAATVFADLLPWLGTHVADNTFVWTHLFDPHGPYRPPAEAPRFERDAVWSKDTIQLSAGTGKLTGAFVPGYVADAGHLDRRHYVANYDSEIASVDQRLGELVKSLDTLGITQDSLVIITADHGESMTDHGRYFCHGSLYEHDLHVPMVVYAPGRVKPGVVVEARTTHLDVVPTLLDYAGIALPPELKGRSLRGLLEGGKAATQAFSVAVVGEGADERLAVRDDRSVKVLVDHAGAAVEAYDLATDPDELTNVYEALRGEADRIAQEARAWMANQLDGDQRAAPPVERKLSTEEEDKLRALGYLE